MAEKDGAAGGATVDIDKVVAYKDDELEKVDGDRGDDVGEVVEGEEKEEVVDVKTEKKEGKVEDKVEEKVEEEEEEPRDRKGRFVKSPMVPKGRLDEALRAKTEAEEALRELTGIIEENFSAEAKEEAPSSVIEKLEREINEFEIARAKALKDGDEEKVAQFSGAIRVRERQINRIEAQGLSEAARAQAREEVRTDAIVAKLESMYPALNPDDKDNYDEELVGEVRVLRNGLMKSGMILSEATAKAVNYVMRGLKPAEDAASEKKPSVKDKIEAARKQPGNLGKSVMGADHDRVGGDMKNIDPGKLTEKEFDALPDSVRARLRGDLV